MSSLELKLVRAVLTVMILALVPFASLSAEQYSQVRIFLTAPSQLVELTEDGLHLDHVQISKTENRLVAETILNSSELAILRNSRLSFVVIIPDFEAHFNARPGMSSVERRTMLQNSVVRGFEFGSMGGYYTLAELESELDSMRQLYPNLISAPASIGTSVEGRDIWMVKISDNPEMAENEPQVFYNSLHHAREPQSMMTNIYYMYYLLENYGSDPQVTFLVDNRELYFVPCINPDGYVYNQQTNPNGGGNWRKNRRDNGGSFGVDLNRNYGFNWGYDNNGSSPNPSSSTYRGPGAFSEPETQAVRDFCESHNFKIALNYHSFGNLLIYPWGFIASFETPDSSTFRAFGSDMTQFNNYTFGTGDQTVGYLVNGDSDDWMYGEQTSKNKILSLTPEVGRGSDGFWPAENRIIPLAEENIYPNLYVAMAAGSLVKPAGLTLVDDGDHNGYVDPGESAVISVAVANFGLSEANGVRLRLLSNDPNVSILTPDPSTSFNLAPGDSSTFEDRSFIVDPNASIASSVNLELEVLSDNGFAGIFPLPPIVIGTPAIAFQDGAESGTAGWSTGQSWDATGARAYSGGFSFTDSPGSEYNGNANNAMTSLSPIDLSSAQGAFLEFWAQWAIEGSYDFAQILASTDGATWTPLQGLYTTEGSGQGVQTPGEPGYDGLQTSWVRERVDLSSYLGEPQVYFRFRLRSDGFVEEDGWYLDDIRVSIYSSPTGIGNNNGVIETFVVDQNFPNPFNPSTTIRYQLATSDDITIAVFNELGQRVALLYNGPQSAGRHEVRWNGTSQSGLAVASGVYYLKLTAGNRHRTLMMQLIR